jgi:hypothetical protein
MHVEERFRKYEIKDCENVEEFMNKYRKGIGSGKISFKYIKGVYEKLLKKNGYIIILPAFSVTGKTVAFYKESLEMKKKKRVKMRFECFNCGENNIKRGEIEDRVSAEKDLSEDSTLFGICPRCKDLTAFRRVHDKKILIGSVGKEGVDFYSELLRNSGLKITTEEDGDDFKIFAEGSNVDVLYATIINIIEHVLPLRQGL